MNEIILETISWSAPEYSHEEKGNDWFWSIGVITIVAFGIALWFHSYIFAIFLLLAGASLILFTLRHPSEVTYIIETKGLTMGRDFYEWSKIKSFNFKKIDDQNYDKLLIETTKYFLPVYTIPIHKGKEDQVKKNLILLIPKSEIQESPSMAFAEKLGF